MYDKDALNSTYIIYVILQCISNFAT